MTRRFPLLFRFTICEAPSRGNSHKERLDAAVSHQSPLIALLAVGFGLAFVLSCLSIVSLGFILAAVVKTARTAQITGMAFFFPMIFLSGATIPIEIMPAKVQVLSRFIPLTYVVRMLKGLWFGQEWSRFAGEAALLLVLTAVSLAVTVKIFRWE